MPDSPDNTRFDELLAAFLDETIDEAELDEFAELVTSDAESTADLRSQLFIDSQLSEFKNEAKSAETFQQRLEAGIEAEADSEEFVGKVLEKAKLPAKRRSLLMPILGIVSIALLALVGVKLLNPGTSPTTENFVATVTAIKGDVSGEKNPIKVNDQLVSDILEIPRGFVELEFANGAQMGVLGPARFELVNANRVFCHYGKLRVGVPPAGRGFTVVTPSSEIVDLGTEFALHVSNQGATELHVFEGKVDAYNSRRDPKSRKSYTKGQAVRISKSQARRDMKSDASAFAGIPAYKGKRKPVSSNHFRIWKSLSDRTKQDPRLVVYYDFQNTGSSRLLNIATNSAGRAELNGVIKGATWSGGPWVGKKALRFNKKHDKVQVNIPGEFEALTLAGWVKVDEYNHLKNALFTTVGANPGEIYLHYWNHGGDVLGIRSGNSSKSYSYLVKDVIDANRLGQWFHFAAVVDTKTSRVTKYINSGIVLDQPFEFDGPLRLGDCAIGNRFFNLSDDTDESHCLNGCVAELMIFKAPLDRSEIRHISRIQSSK